MAQAGVGADWAPTLNWIIQKESSGNPAAQNPTSSAYGLGQLLDSTWKTYGSGDRSNPVDQVAAMAKYAKGRYVTPEKALEFWQQHNWY